MKRINNNNNNNNNNNKLKYFGIFLLFLLSMVNVNSIVTYNIDEGFGGIIFDSSNNLKTGTIIGSPNNAIWVSSSLTGTSSLMIKTLKNTRFRILNYPQLTPTGNFSLGLVYNPTTLFGKTQTILSKFNSYSIVISPTLTGLNDISVNLYLGAASTLHVIPVSNISYGKFNTLTLTFNGTSYIVYSNGIKQPTIINSLLPLSNNVNDLILFNSQSGQSIKRFLGLIDEFKIINKFSNSSLYNNNNNNNNNNNTMLQKLILNSTPSQNQSFIDSVKFYLHTSRVSTCNLYLDNNFYKHYTSVLVKQDTINFNKNYGNHTYFYNCFDNVSNEISNITSFKVKRNPSSHIKIIFNGTNFNTNSFNLELVTPCLNKGFSFGGIVKPYRPISNPNGVYFHDIQNGVVDMNLPVGVHTFCLINGIVTYDTYNLSHNWTSNIIKQIHLGDFRIPSNITSIYSISLDTFDMYNKQNPKAWGQSWTSIISSLIALMIGIIILIGGMTTKEGKAVLIGGLLIMFSLGYQLSNLVMGVIL